MSDDAKWFLKGFLIVLMGIYLLFPWVIIDNHGVKGLREINKEINGESAYIVWVLSKVDKSNPYEGHSSLRRDQQ